MQTRQTVILYVRIDPWRAEAPSSHVFPCFFVVSRQRPARRQIFSFFFFQMRILLIISGWIWMNVFADGTCVSSDVSRTLMLLFPDESTRCFSHRSIYLGKSKRVCPAINMKFLYCAILINDIEISDINLQWNGISTCTYVYACTCRMVIAGNTRDCKHR